MPDWTQLEITDKGTYLGPADQKLGAEQVRELETRTNMQAWY